LIVYRTELDRWSPGAHAGTFRGNQLAFAAGAAALRYTVEADLPGNAEAMGCRLIQQLRDLTADVPAVGGVRGRGLMIGVELVDPDADRDPAGRLPPDGRAAARLQRACLRHGLIVEVGGPDGAVLRFLPPLTLTVEDVDAISGRFGSALQAMREHQLETPR
jgi:diaminobutyrate-2-oxoglutarate transaminase